MFSAALRAPVSMTYSMCGRAGMFSLMYFSFLPACEREWKKCHDCCHRTSC